MSDDFVTFNIRYKKALFELKIKTPGDVSGFIEKLKDELKLEETDELVILCPTPDGKMKTKLAYNAVTKEIYCNVELVVTVIHELPDDTKAQFVMLSNKIDKLATKIDGLSDDLTKKIDENKTSTFSSIRSILAEHLDIGSGNKSKNNSLGEEDLDIKPNLGVRQKKIKKDKEKLSSTAGTNDNSSTTSENLKLDAQTTAQRLIPKDIDMLLEMLVADGFTNTIQNIIVLKRFDNNYEKAKNYLKSSAT
ncbi:uncharacterized protein LOC100572942 isoform X1 [Acyrthosiphon pisum]|uniref:UBA domain-containing protein n=1 Tax=Acyrthosiphon pisum TaxID=7029 RepID=A0A8R2HAI3_ACYPI|nr:uncharacterized protein LOC100572942 isoform X1 [Acyrthosiphon pisum]|eukprot:XP_016662431.1 PREDICTED: uncharacterized protein LOC100572942 isoform X1 [Acyrthosiphon pisum]